MTREIIEMAKEAGGTTNEKIWAMYPAELEAFAKLVREDALAQPEQEPVAWGMPGKDGFIFDVICPEEHAREEGGYTIPLYTTPPQRTWVGLTDEERNTITRHHAYVDNIIKATEAKLKEKNT